MWKDHFIIYVKITLYVKMQNVCLLIHTYQHKLNIFIYKEFSYDEGRKNYCAVLVQIKSEIHAFHKNIK